MHPVSPHFFRLAINIAFLRINVPFARDTMIMMGLLYHSLHELSRKYDALCGITEGGQDADLFRKFHPFTNWNNCELFMLLYHKSNDMSSDLWLISEYIFLLFLFLPMVHKKKRLIAVKKIVIGEDGLYAASWGKHL